MPNRIKIRRGAKTTLPIGGTEAGELRFAIDTKELFIDDGSNNVQIGGTPTNFPISTAMQSALDAKAPLFSPALTGTPTAPTATPGTDTTQIATMAAVKAATDQVKSDMTDATITAQDPGDGSIVKTLRVVLSNLWGAIGSRLSKSANLSDLGNAATARTNLGVFQPATTDFLASGSYSIPPGATLLRVRLISAGGGGGSGRRGAAGTGRSGGGGGGGGAVLDAEIRVSDLPLGTDTLNINVGLGGAGAAARTTDNTDGAAGTAGGNTTISAGGVQLLFAGGGGGGLGGTATTAAGGASGAGQFNGVSGGAGNSTVAGGNGNASQITGAGAGGGGGIDANNNPFSGGSGAKGANLFGNGSLAVALAGVINGGAGGNALASLLAAIAGNSGGGGGGGGTSSPGGRGGDGALYGGGGGGGGASANGLSSGAGGSGANGFVRITAL